MARASRVFISYCHADRRRVQALGLLLEALGHEVFLDHLAILPGRRWQPALKEGLATPYRVAVTIDGVMTVYDGVVSEEKERQTVIELDR